MQPSFFYSGARVSVVIPTSNFGAKIVPTLDALQKSEIPFLELIVVDQSKDHYTAARLRHYHAPTLRYVRLRTQGLSIAQNIGLDLARGDIVVFIGDDCLVDPAWLGRLLQAFADPSIAVVFSDVHPMPQIQPEGAEPRAESWVMRSLDEWRHAPVDAINPLCVMALRREIVLNLGGFDPAFGLGARFHTRSDIDIALRVLLAGHSISRADLPPIYYGAGQLHPALKAFASVRPCRSALFLKLARCGHVAFLGYLMQDVWRDCVAQPMPFSELCKRVRTVFNACWQPIDGMSKTFMPSASLRRSERICL